MSLAESIKAINTGVRKINRNFFMYYKNDKSSRVFILLGAILLVTGVILLNYVYMRITNLAITFTLGFMVMLLVITGYSLMHKSLRGEWL